MNIRTKLILSVGILAGMIILLVALSVVNLQILTATEPDSPAAMPGLQRALLWISVTGGVCILASIVLLVWLPRSISKPIQELTHGIFEIANHNYEKRLDMSGHEEFSAGTADGIPCQHTERYSCCQEVSGSHREQYSRAYHRLEPGA